MTAFDSGVFREKNNTANAMIRWQLVRAFELGTGRDHRPNIELERDVCQVFHEPEDSIYRFRTYSISYDRRPNAQ